MIESQKKLIHDYWDMVKYEETIMYYKNSDYDDRVFLYKIDQKRKEMHDELCEMLKVEKEKMKSITDNLDKCDCFESFLKALEKLINDENENL